MYPLILSLEALIASIAFEVGSLLTTPFPRLKASWFRATLPKMLSYLEELQGYITLKDEAGKSLYRATQQMKTKYTAILRAVNESK